VDLERLLFLLRLLTTFNGLDASDPGTSSALAEICTPPPLALREQHLQQSQGVVELYTGSSKASTSSL